MGTIKERTMIASAPSISDMQPVHQIEWFAKDFSHWSQEVRPPEFKHLLHDSFLKYGFEKLINLTEDILQDLVTLPYSNYKDGFDLTMLMKPHLDMVIAAMLTSNLNKVLKSEYKKLVELNEELDELTHDFKSSISLRADDELMSLMRSI